MQKIFSTILALVFTFSLCGPAMAKGVKAPKTLCLEGASQLISLSTSKGGKAVLGGVKTTNYDVQGLMFQSGSDLNPFPVAGSGFINGNAFQCTLSGQFPDGSDVISFEGQLIWTVGNPTAVILAIFQSSSGFTDISIPVAIVDCNEPF